MRQQDQCEIRDQFINWGEVKYCTVIRIEARSSRLASADVGKHRFAQICIINLKPNKQKQQTAQMKNKWLKKCHPLHWVLISTNYLSNLRLWTMQSTQCSTCTSDPFTSNIVISQTFYQSNQTSKLAI